MLGIPEAEGATLIVKKWPFRIHFPLDEIFNVNKKFSLIPF